MKTNKALKVWGTTILGTAAIVAPVATTVSCGSSESYDLTVGIRPEDQPLWDKVAAQFKKATGVSVGFKWVSNQSQNYALWSGSSLMPDITIAGANESNTGVSEGYFAKMDLSEIAADQSLVITGQDADYAENKDLRYNNKYFETNMIETQKSGDGKVNDMAVIYGPKMTYAWKKVPTTAGHFYHVINDSDELPSGDTGPAVPLEYYVPDGAGKVVKAIDAPATYAAATTAQQKLLFSLKAGHHRLMSTSADIQEFISRAAAQEDVAANGDIAKSTGITLGDFTAIQTATPAAADAQKLIISTGARGYQQRLGSISKVLFDKVTTDKNNAFADAKIRVGAISTPSYSFASLAYGTSLQNAIAGNKDTTTDQLKALWNLDKDNKLKDGNVYTVNEAEKATKLLISKSKITTKDLSSLDLAEFASNFGYFTGGVFGGSQVDADMADRQVSFAKAESLFLGDGALWQWGGIKDKIENKFKGSKADDLLTSFGQPYQTTGVDGYAIKKTDNADKMTLEKKFIRFLMQKRVAADITGTKAISTLKDAQGLQDKIEGARQIGLESAGAKLFLEGGALNGVATMINLPATIAVSSTPGDVKVNGKDTTPVYSPYNDYYAGSTPALWKDGKKDPLAGVKDAGTTLVKFADTRTHNNEQYQNALELA